MPQRLLIVGLGNPGNEYAKTRHNVGFMLLDFLPKSDPWKTWKNGKSKASQWRSEGGSGDYHLLKPQGFMNLSGLEVREFAHFHKIRPSDILVCYDDFALPFGKRRMRLKGSSGGHNGMDSIIEQLGTQDIPRIRIGIGPVPPRRDPKDFVLGNFSKSELQRLDDEVFARVLEGVRAVSELGFERAMNLVNAPDKEPEAE